MTPQESKTEFVHLLRAAADSFDENGYLSDEIVEYLIERVNDLVEDEGETTESEGV